MIFVKLQQFAADDQRQCVIDTRSAEWSPGLVDGLEVLPLHEHQREHVALVRWAPNTRFQPHWHQGGEEILVVEGEFCDEHGVYPVGSWIRSPDQSQHAPFTGDDGALIYVKVGHLS
mgnify:FL=1